MLLFKSMISDHDFEKQGFSMVLMEENLTTATLISSIEQLYTDRDKYIQAMKNSRQMDSIDMIVNLINKVAK